MKQKIETLKDRKEVKMKKTIWHRGKELTFKEEIDDIDEAQVIIDGWVALGWFACALHEKGKHQIYVGR